MSEYYFANRYKKYYDGGSTMNSSSTLNAAMGIGNTTGGIIDGFNQPDSFGHKSAGASAASGALKGAAAGSVFPGIGTAIGAVVGAGVGYISAKIGNKKAAQRNAVYQGQVAGMQRDQSQTILAQDPALAEGNNGADYYAQGGPLQNRYRMYVEGGSLKMLNDDGGMEVDGASHENGGVQLPEQDAEVEGGETMHDNFVFSKRLGYAQEDLRLEKAIGKIESKGPQTPERRNSIQRLGERREMLKQAQEYHKQTAAHFGMQLPNEDQSDES